METSSRVVLMSEPPFSWEKPRQRVGAPRFFRARLTFRPLPPISVRVADTGVVPPSRKLETVRVRSMQGLRVTVSIMIRSSFL